MEQATIKVDPEDEHLLEEYGWYPIKARNTHYIRAHIPGAGRTHKKVYLHRLITDAPDGMQVDHINGDGLDNRKENLRLCSQVENLRNSKNRKNSRNRYRCVRPSGNKRSTRIQHNKKVYLLGTFDTEEEAAWAYNKAAKEL